MENFVNNFNALDWRVFGTVFVLSIIYAVVLEVWVRFWPETYDDLVWFRTCIGVGYVLLVLAVVIPQNFWLKIVAAFFFASIPIITRSVLVVSLRRREANSRLERGNDKTKTVA